MAKYEIPAADYRINGRDYKLASLDELLDEMNRIMNKKRKNSDDYEKYDLIKEELDCRNRI
jgi:hypothetical protein